MQDIDSFVKGGEAAVSSKLAALEKLAPKADEAQPWFDRAEQFATQNPDEHLLIAIRFYEVADRFKGSDPGMTAMDRSLKELVQDKSAPKSALPPVAIAAPQSAPIAGGSQPVPAADKIKDAEKLIKDLFKAEYVLTDAPGPSRSGRETFAASRREQKRMPHPSTSCCATPATCRSPPVMLRNPPPRRSVCATRSASTSLRFRAT